MARWLAIYGSLVALAFAGCTVLTQGVLDDKDSSPPLAIGGGGEGGEGGGVACSGHEDCPGIDTTCRFRVCDGTCGFENAPEGTGCAEEGGTQCDGDGSCVECLDEDDCTGNDLCIQGICAPAHCADEEQSSGETGIDCGGTCPPCANGQGCVEAGDCISNLCSGGTCAACESHADCAATPGTYCAGGQCVPKKIDGDICEDDQECESGACALEDQTCCDRACSGCEACLAQHTGLTNGECGPVGDDTDPHDACTDAGADSCAEDGQCDGSGSCRLYASGTPCGSDMCSGGTATFEGTCDGSGTCNTPAPDMCAPYTCDATSCRMSCSDQSHCSGNNFCVGTSCVGCGSTAPVTGSCPNAICTGGCDGTTCTVDCTGGASGNCDGGVVCPAGLDCVVNCSDAQSCGGDTITCPAGRSCTVNCDAGNFACQNSTISCADGPCTLNCNAGNDCEGTDFACGPNECSANCSGNTVTVSGDQQSCDYTGSGGC